MKKILLACNAGMSTSLLVSRMEKAAKEKGIEVMITAVGVLEAEKILNEIRDYGLMKEEKVLETALKMIENK